MTTAPDATKAKVMLLDASHSVAYVEGGAGETILFIHGSLCDYRYWKPQLLELSDNFRIVTPSLSHYYPRLPSSYREPFNWSLHVDQMTAFAKRLGPKAVHVVGHSRGANLAYQLTLRNPDRVSTLTLVDPAGPNELEPSEAANTGEVFALRSKAVGLIAEGRVDEGLKLFVDSTSRPGFWERSKDVFQNMARDNAGTLATQLFDALPMFSRAEAQTILCPALIVDGARSPPVYRSNADLLARWIPNSTRATITGASHGLTWSHSGVFDRQLREFLDIAHTARPPSASAQPT
jgi:pimeloyl-ACP methyl ester carboxylesterase